MEYTEEKARELVIEAGHKLTEKKLIARTWGNISARISEREFIITPSGIAYDVLKPENLVKVTIADLSYEGELKPSSEKGVHAAAYELRPEAGFVIHTHQTYASAICAAGEDTPFAPCAAYGLPGTKKLKENTAASIERNPDCKTFLMARHGALCIGTDFEEAFALADELEEKCRELFVSKVDPWKIRSCFKPYLDDFAQIVGPFEHKIENVKSDDPEAVAMIFHKNCLAAAYASAAGPMNPGDSMLQRAVYMLKYSKQKNKV